MFTVVVPVRRENLLSNFNATILRAEQWLTDGKKQPWALIKLKLGVKLDYHVDVVEMRQQGSANLRILPSEVPRSFPELWF